jgi:hypothetical protein
MFFAVSGVSLSIAIGYELTRVFRVVTACFDESVLRLPVQFRVPDGAVAA